MLFLISLSYLLSDFDWYWIIFNSHLIILQSACSREFLDMIFWKRSNVYEIHIWYACRNKQTVKNQTVSKSKVLHWNKTYHNSARMQEISRHYHVDTLFNVSLSLSHSSEISFPTENRRIHISISRILEKMTYPLIQRTSSCLVGIDRRMRRMRCARDRFCRGCSCA